MSARIQSLQVALPLQVATVDGPLFTGMRKTAVEGALFLGPRALDGDGCGDTEHHGLEDQAVCVIPAQHYGFWRQELGLDAQSFPYGSFGENFTVSGQDESSLRIGDRWQVGEAEVEVTKPRPPCVTLNRVWCRSDFAALMGRKGMVGWYLRVLRSGVVAAGQVMELSWRNPDALTVAEAWASKGKAE